jgi:hypothetical protein
MTVKQSWWRRGFTLSLAVGALLACGIRQDEFDCENAVAHLQECCPGFSGSSVSCTYNAGACGGTTYPALDITTSDCIRQASCGTLVSQGICDRAMRAPLGSSSITSTTTYAICPPGPEAPDASGDDGSPGSPGYSVMLGCTRSTDCEPGAACCVSASTNAGALDVVSSCSAVPCSLLQLCASASDCPAGQECVLSPLVRSLGMTLTTCSPPPDAGQDASADAPSDAPQAAVSLEAEAAVDVADVSTDSGVESGVDAITDGADAADVEAAP